MAMKSKKSPAKAKKAAGGTAKKATKKAAPEKAVKKIAAKAPVKKATKPVKKAAAKAPVKNAVKAVKKTVNSVKKTVKKAVIKSRPVVKKAVKAAKKTVNTLKKAVAKAPAKKAAAKKAIANSSARPAAKAKASKPMAKLSAKPTVKAQTSSPKKIVKAPTAKPVTKPEEMPLTENKVPSNEPVTPVFTQHAENIEPGHITAQAVKTEGVPYDEKHPDHPLFEKPVTPADIATVGMNNKKDILNDLSVKHANNHKLGKNPIAGKKPLW